MQIIQFKDITSLRNQILDSGLQEHILLKLDGREVVIDDNCLQRLTQVACDFDASITYCYYRDVLDDGSEQPHPLSDYQIGSVRDDFDFGPLVLLNTADVIAAYDYIDDSIPRLDGGWYALRLQLSADSTVACVPEYLYSAKRIDNRRSGQKQHDYVDPRRRDYQIQMENDLLDYLNQINGICPARKAIDFSVDDKFPVTASVIIPVRNRVGTIRDAVRSALGQQAPFDFNVIVVDNSSTDGTFEKLLEFEDPRLVVIRVDESEHLGIGGCWNRAINSDMCGRFAVQLDSDDIYSGPDTLARIVAKFTEKNCAMVIGSYTMTDFDLNPIGPGLIDHKEWTDINGPDNALRINGFGAPRAFYTPVARAIQFPNVSYGEDYAMALRISREFFIGRIYDSLYFCRRWEGNSDADLSTEQVRAHNTYKDFVRSTELSARIAINCAEQQEDDDDDYDDDYDDDIDIDLDYDFDDDDDDNDDTNNN